jgi:hypothetical protein
VVKQSTAYTVLVSLTNSLFDGIGSTLLAYNVPVVSNLFVPRNGIHADAIYLVC